MCKRRLPLLGEVAVNDKGKPFYSDLLVDFERDGDSWRYWFKPEAIEGLASVEVAKVARRYVAAARKVRRGRGSY